MSSRKIEPSGVRAADGKPGEEDLVGTVRSLAAAVGGLAGRVGALEDVARSRAMEHGDQRAMLEELGRRMDERQEFWTAWAEGAHDATIARVEGQVAELRADFQETAQATADQLDGIERAVRRIVAGAVGESEGRVSGRLDAIDQTLNGHLEVCRKVGEAFLGG
jgi:hypothetical protein